MDIDFCGPAVPAQDGGISYQVKVDGKKIACRVSMEALQDIDPPSRLDEPMTQFEAHKSEILNIAGGKIRAGLVQDNRVWVLTADL